MAVTREMIMRKVLPVFALLLSAALLAGSSGAASVHTHAVDRRVDAADLVALRAALAEKLKSLHEAASFPGATLGFVLPDGKSDGEVTFDYRLRPGVVTHSNAIALMRAVGLDV